MGVMVGFEGYVSACVCLVFSEGEGSLMLCGLCLCVKGKSEGSLRSLKL